MFCPNRPEKALGLVFYNRNAVASTGCSVFNLGKSYLEGVPCREQGPGGTWPCPTYTISSSTTVFVFIIPSETCDNWINTKIGLCNIFHAAGGGWCGLLKKLWGGGVHYPPSQSDWLAFIHPAGSLPSLLARSHQFCWLAFKFCG